MAFGVQRFFLLMLMLFVWFLVSPCDVTRSLLCSVLITRWRMSISWRAPVISVLRFAVLEESSSSSSSSRFCPERDVRGGVDLRVQPEVRAAKRHLPGFERRIDAPHQRCAGSRACVAGCNPAAASFIRTCVARLRSKCFHRTRIHVGRANHKQWKSLCSSR